MKIKKSTSEEQFEPHPKCRTLITLLGISVNKKYSNFKLLTFTYNNNNNKIEEQFGNHQESGPIL